MKHTPKEADSIGKVFGAAIIGLILLLMWVALVLVLTPLPQVEAAAFPYMLGMRAGMLIVGALMVMDATHTAYKEIIFRAVRGSID